MNFKQQAICFPCQGDNLFGILSLPERPSPRGVLVIVGGPQYRAGSHRQFTLLANDLASHGTPVMRFDYRGMGDSEGDTRSFEEVQEDIRHATDRFFAEVPALTEIVLWGLCDAASASLFYAHRDARVQGLVLLNPWVRTPGGMARAYLRHYYLSRLLDKELWNKIRNGQFDFIDALRSLMTMTGTAFKKRPSLSSETATGMAEAPRTEAASSLPDRMLDGLCRFKGRVLLVISGNDLTAKEFLDVVNGSRKWKKTLASTRIQRRDLAEANHTFALREWRNQVADWTRDWIKSW
ncbi:hydrolase 1, exosortase A system-associated [Noviherbaspirillum sp. ST9]|uniref:hydrolase 1, exosortase A system-associated n=1 Tax=Noviherbaspirillum sp. ST9 TaxID=3401606 RepID=UPI003B589B7A